MAKKTIFRYFVDIRLTNESDHRNSLHIDACSRVGAMYQAIMLLKRYKIEKAFSVVVREEAYPIEKRKRIKAIKEKNKTDTRKKDNKKAIELIKSRLDCIKDHICD